MKNFIPVIYFCLALFSCNTISDKKKDRATQMDTNTKPVPFAAKANDEVTAPVQNGVFEERYENGIIKVKGNYAGGKRHGSWVSFFKNGKTWSEGLYVNGAREGMAVVWYENGQKYYEGKYEKGKEVGTWKFWDDKGALIKEVNYDKHK